MLRSIIEPQLILLPFAFLQWFLIWSLRFLPRAKDCSNLSRGIIKVAVAATLSITMIAEMLLYRSLTAQDSLKGDNFFFAGIMGQSLVSAALVYRLNSFLRRKEADSRGDRTDGPGFE
jgi:hypothetical protein